MEVAMLHAALILTLALKAQSHCDSEFLQQSWALLKTADWGHLPYERGAFAVLDADGRVTFVMWRSEHAAFAASYTGPIPGNTFAIVHTHPNGHPIPSDDDCASAARLGMPVYVVTRNAVTRTNGSRWEYITLGDWNPERCARR